MNIANANTPHIENTAATRRVLLWPNVKGVRAYGINSAGEVVPVEHDERGRPLPNRTAQRRYAFLLALAQRDIGPLSGQFFHHPRGAAEALEYLSDKLCWPESMLMHRRCRHIRKRCEYAWDWLRLDLGRLEGKRRWS